MGERCSRNVFAFRGCFSEQHPQLRGGLAQVNVKGNPLVCPLKCPHRCPLWLLGYYAVFRHITCARTTYLSQKVSTDLSCRKALGLGTLPGWVIRVRSCGVVGVDGVARARGNSPGWGEPEAGVWSRPDFYWLPWLHYGLHTESLGDKSMAEAEEV